jgi:CBS domain-containing protein
MTHDVVTIPRDARTSRAELEMKLAEIRHLPVVDREGRLVGVLSSRDLQRWSGLGARSSIQVDELMRGVPQTVRADGDAAEAAALLINKKIGCLPVVDEREHVVGIITETDFLNVAFQALSGVPLRGRSVNA